MAIGTILSVLIGKEYVTDHRRRTERIQTRVRSTLGIEEPSLSISALLIVSGAPGVGKSTTIDLCLSRSIAGTALFDIDWLLAPASDLTGRDIRYASDRWPFYNTVWLRFLEGVARNGQLPVLFAPLAPSDLDTLATTFPAFHWLLLDCEEAAHRRRLANRGWPGDAINSALDDARDLRATLRDDVVDSAAGSPLEVAAAVRLWIQQHVD